ncbi:MAG: zf-HC2 domain-containing protein [Treponema sp.]|jgi:hypothetical protein|nr:zf-HC2 domain-containing protein [Treponema sp.]
MCPDRQLLSVYCDGELPSPWKEKLESHLSQCSHCRNHLETFRMISPSAAGSAAAPALPETAVLRAAQDRVWQKLEATVNIPVEPNSHPAVHTRESAFWQRRISLPFPVAAAAAVIIVIAVAAFWVRRPSEQPVIPNMIMALEEEFDSPGIIPVSDMNSVLQYLGNRDSGDILIMRLPESRNFINSGEPAIIRAADYPRAEPGRRKR